MTSRNKPSSSRPAHRFGEPVAALLLGLVVLAFATVIGCGSDADDEEVGAADDAETPVDGVTDPDGSDVPADATDQGPVSQPGVLPIIELAGGIFEAPYPTDLRIKSDGFLDLTGFPNPNESEMVAAYVTFAEEAIRGYSLTPSVSFPFEAALDLDSVTEPSNSASPGSNVILVNVDKESAGFGRRHPVNAYWFGDGEAIFQSNNTLTIQPLFGTPLLEGTTYAAVVMRGVTDSQGAPTGQLRIVLDGLEGTGPLADLFAPLRFWMAHGGQDVKAAEVSVATVFTTDRPTLEMKTIAAFVRDELPAPTVKDIALGEGSTAHYDMYEGHYDGPNFQGGDKPYKTEGDIRFDADGKPIVQFMEPLRFALTVPKGEAPPGGWPLVLYGHGTGGDWKSFAGQQIFQPAEVLAKVGIAALSIDQPLHGIRYEGENADSALNSFNFLNPYAGRSNFRQSAIDVIALVRLARESLVVPAEVSVTMEKVTFDDDNVFFFGHSHGGLSAGLFLPFVPELRAVVMSGAGGGLSQTLMLRKDPLDISAAIRLVLKIKNKAELTVAHPVVALMQNIVDATDPLSYAPLYRYPGAGLPPVSILMTEGPLDLQTPSITTDNLAAAAEIPLLKPTDHQSLAHILTGLSEIQKPVSENFVSSDGKATSVLVHFAGSDHFAVFNNGNAAETYRQFLETAIEAGVPTVD